MRKVTLIFMGPVRRPEGMAASSLVEIDEGQRLDELLANLGYGPEERARLRVSSRGRSLTSSEQLGEVEELTVFLPLGGG